MKSKYLLLYVSALCGTAMEVSAQADIQIRGFTGLNVPFEIDDEDNNPNQDVTQFGNVFCNESLDRNFEIRNRGNTTLTVFVNGNSPSVSLNSDYSFPDFPTNNFTIAPNSERSFRIRYTPSSHGEGANPVIRIDSNDPDDEGQYTFALSGSGRCGDAAAVFNPSDDNVLVSNNASASAGRGTDFGTVDAGEEVERRFAIRNSTGAPDVLRIRNPRIIGPDASQFRFRSLGTGNLNEGSNRNFFISFEPSEAGNHTATFVFDNNDPNANPYSFALRGTGFARPEISMEGRRASGGVFNDFDPIPDGLGLDEVSTMNGTRFDGTNVGGSNTSRFRINNTGNGILTLSDPDLLDFNGVFNFINFPASVAPGDSEEFQIIFEPTTFGVRSAVMGFQTNDTTGGEESFTFSIQAEGFAPGIEVEGSLAGNTFFTIPNGDTSPRSDDGTDLGSVNVTGGQAQRLFRVRNIGNQTLNIQFGSEIYLTPTSNTLSEDFNITNLNAGNPVVSIAPGTPPDEFNINFTPSTSGIRNGTVRIFSNDPNTPLYTFALTGIGNGNGDLEVSGRPSGQGIINFDEIDNGDTTPRRGDGTLFQGLLGERVDVGDSRDAFFQLENVGDGQLTFTNPPTSSNPAFTILGFDDSAFDPNDGARIFTIRFSPTTFGTQTSTISIFNDASGEETYTFTVQGEGRGPEMDLQAGFSDFSTSIASGDTTPSIFDGTNVGGIPSNGTMSLPFRISNEGTSRLTIFRAEITGPHADEFNVRDLFPFEAGLFTDAFVSAESPRDFIIEFAPNGTGNRDAVISFITNDPDENPYTFAIRGVGNPNDTAAEITVTSPLTSQGFIPIENGDVTPATSDATDFGEIEEGENQPRFFSIRNSGDVDLVINAITSENSAFTVTSAPSEIGVDGIESFGINFDAAVIGPNQSSVITVFSNDPNSSVYTFTVSADVTGVADLSLTSVKGVGILNGDTTPTTNDGTNFGVFEFEGGLALNQFFIENVSGQALTIVSTTSSSGLFTLSELPSSLEIGQGEVELQISFNPRVEGEQEATIQINTLTKDEVKGAFTFRVSAVVEPNGAPEIVVRSLKDVLILNGDSSPSFDDGTDFGIVDGVVRSNFRYENVGNVKFTPTSVTSSSQSFSIELESDNTIAPGQTSEFQVTYSPTGNPGTQEQTTITINGLGEDSAETLSYSFAMLATLEEETVVELEQFQISDGDIIVDVTVTDGVSFRLERSFDLQGNNWSTVPGFSNIVGQGRQRFEVKDIINQFVAPKAFFRIMEN